MNADTGHLINLGENDIAPENYTPIPEELIIAARKKLNGKNETYVSLTSGGKLSNWAKEKRKKKVSKNSRKQNRR